MTRRRAGAACALVLVAAAGIWPAAALAHGLVGRADLPIPPYLFGWAASIVLVVSFVALAALWKKPRLEDAREKPLFTVPRFVDPLCAVIGVALFGIAIYLIVRPGETLTEAYERELEQEAIRSELHNLAPCPNCPTQKATSVGPAERSR